MKEKSVKGKFTNRALMLLALAFIASACNKGLVGSKKSLIVDEFAFEYFTARAKVNYNNGKQKVNATANIRMKKDSIIWMSFSKLGIEGVRLKVDRDSIYILDRLQKRYSQRSFTQISKELDVEVDFNLLESVMLGNLIYPYSKEKLAKEDDYIKYNQVLENFVFDNYIGAETKKLEKLVVNDNLSKATISVNYGEFQAIEDEVFPFNIAASVKYEDESKDDIQVKIGFSRAQVQENRLSFPFSAPSKYKRI